MRNSVNPLLGFTEAHEKPSSEEEDLKDRRTKKVKMGEGTQGDVGVEIIMDDRVVDASESESLAEPNVLHQEEQAAVYYASGGDGIPATEEKVVHQMATDEIQQEKSTSQTVDSTIKVHEDLREENQERINKEDMGNKLEGDKEDIMYGPWMIVKRFQRRKYINYKSGGKLSADSSGNSKQSNPNLEPRKNKQVESPGGSRFELLIDTEEKNEAFSNEAPSFGPHAAVSKARGVISKNKRYGAVQSIGSGKPVTNQNKGRVNRSNGIDNRSISVETPESSAEQIREREKDDRVRRE
ncbi:hypothetical protein RIF29_24685 [Crotalaria pallida]|uniref:Uncharacterized protein n=1 Tax=Crotalaria pallida TaxID=3830 RepID=A0AAN9HZ50_CROPI